MFHVGLAKSKSSVFLTDVEGIDAETEAIEYHNNNVSEINRGEEYKGKDSFSLLDQASLLNLNLGSLPMGFNYRPIGDETNESLATRLQGLPGGLSMDHDIAANYFGVQGKLNFMERYQWMNRQRQKTLSDSYCPVGTLKFDTNKRNIESSGAFGARRNANDALRFRAEAVVFDQVINQEATRSLSTIDNEGNVDVKLKGLDPLDLSCRRSRRNRVPEPPPPLNFHDSVKDHSQLIKDEIRSRPSTSGTPSLSLKKSKTFSFAPKSKPSSKQGLSSRKDGTSAGSPLPMLSTSTSASASPTKTNAKVVNILQFDDNYEESEKIILHGEVLPENSLQLSIEAVQSRVKSTTSSPNRRMQKARSISSTIRRNTNSDQLMDNYIHDTHSKTPNKRPTTTSSASLSQSMTVYDDEDMEAEDLFDEVQLIMAVEHSKSSSHLQLHSRSHSRSSNSSSSHSRPSTTASISSLRSTTSTSSSNNSKSTNEKCPPVLEKGIKSTSRSLFSSSNNNNKTNNKPSATGNSRLLASSSSSSSSSSLISTTSHRMPRPSTSTSTSTSTSSSLLNKKKSYSPLEDNDNHTKEEVEEEENEDNHLAAPTSPRSRFLDSCIREGLLPRSSLIVRRSLTKTLQLQHHGLGDARGVLLAEVLGDLPFISAVNLSDNNFTDVALVPILAALTKLPQLLEVDLSKNRLGPPAAAALFDFLESPHCLVERLVLRHADVDDYECAKFVVAMKKNLHVIDLDLTSNLIGSAESLNSVQPDIITGGEALADLLRGPSCRLQSLKLGWNMIRLDGAIELVQSLAWNPSLTLLDLSYNSLGSEGGMAIGGSMAHHPKLKTLLLANNSLDAKACLAICGGILQNQEIATVSLDGNPVGEEGGRCLMMMSTFVGYRVKITAHRCNIGIKDTRCWFDSHNILGHYVFHLENPFDRGVAILLCYLVASHHSYIFSRFELDPTENTEYLIVKSVERRKRNTSSSQPLAPSGKIPLSNNTASPTGAAVEDKKTTTNPQVNNTSNTNTASSSSSSSPIILPTSRNAKKIELVSRVSNEKIKFFDSRHLDIMSNLRKLEEAASNTEKGIQYFRELDEDGSEELDHQEFAHLLSNLGLNLTTQRVKEIIDDYDVDMGGTIGLAEFLLFLRTQAQQAGEKLKDLTEEPVLCLSEEKAPYRMYLPPTSGTLFCSVVDGFSIKPIHRVLSVLDRENIENVAKQSGETADMTSMGIQAFKVRLDEAVDFADLMIHDSQGRITSLLKLLPQVLNPEEARSLVRKLLRGQASDLMQLKDQMGALYRVLLGTPNGFYQLDLSQRFDRLCLVRLLEMNRTYEMQKMEAFKHQQLPSCLGDTSQKGNWTCFRNEVFNGEMIVLHSDFASPLPRQGILEFDFFLLPLCRQGWMIGLDSEDGSSSSSSSLFNSMDEQKTTAAAVAVTSGTSISAASNNNSSNSSGNSGSANGKMALSDDRFLQVLIRHFLLFPHEKDIAIQRLQELKKQEIQYMKELAVFTRSTPKAGAANGASKKKKGKGEGFSAMNEGNPTFDHAGNSHNNNNNNSSSGSSSGSPLPVFWSDEREHFECCEKAMTVRETFYQNLLERRQQLELFHRFEEMSDDYLKWDIPMAWKSLLSGKVPVVSQHQQSTTATGTGGATAATGGATAATAATGATGAEATTTTSLTLEEFWSDLSILSIQDRQFGTHYLNRGSTLYGRRAAIEGNQKRIIISREALLHQQRHQQAQWAQWQLQFQSNEGSSDANEDELDRIRSKSYDSEELEAESNPTLSRLPSSSSSSSSSSPTSSLHPPPILGTAIDDEEAPLLHPIRTSSGEMASSLIKPSNSTATVTVTATGMRMTKKKKVLRMDETSLRYRMLLTSPQVTNQAKAVRMVDWLYETLAFSLLSCRQLMFLMQVFYEMGSNKSSTYFGTYRVELLISLMHTIIDFHHFPKVLNCLTPFELGCLQARVGMLSLFNPLWPQGWYVLQIKRQEEWQLAKCLVVLHVFEAQEKGLKGWLGKKECDRSAMGTSSTGSPPSLSPIPSMIGGGGGGSGGGNDKTTLNSTTMMTMTTSPSSYHSQRRSTLSTLAMMASSSTDQQVMDVVEEEYDWTQHLEDLPEEWRSLEGVLDGGDWRLCYRRDGKHQLYGSTKTNNPSQSTTGPNPVTGSSSSSSNLKRGDSLTSLSTLSHGMLLECPSAIRRALCTSTLVGERNIMRELQRENLDLNTKAYGKNFVVENQGLWSAAFGKAGASNQTHP